MRPTQDVEMARWSVDSEEPQHQSDQSAEQTLSLQSPQSGCHQLMMIMMMISSFTMRKLLVSALFIYLQLTNFSTNTLYLAGQSMVG